MKQINIKTFENFPLNLGKPHHYSKSHAEECKPVTQYFHTKPDSIPKHHIRVAKYFTKKFQQYNNENCTNNYKENFSSAVASNLKYLKIAEKNNKDYENKTNKLCQPKNKKRQCGNTMIHKNFQPIKTQRIPIFKCKLKQILSNVSNDDSFLSKIPRGRSSTTASSIIFLDINA